ncbi:MAG: recombinase zinc beta ribbon domain-containing protein [Planctomycetota bacterium]
MVGNDLTGEYDCLVSLRSVEGLTRAYTLRAEIEIPARALLVEGLDRLRRRTQLNMKDEMHDRFWEAFKPFTKTDVDRILKNPVYVGKIRQKGKIHAGKHEPIIAMDLWDAVQANLPKKKVGQRKHGRPRTFVYRLTGQVICGVCGGFMTAGAGTGRNGVHRYYKCTRVWDGSERCSMRMVPARVLENVVVERIKELNRSRRLVHDILASSSTRLAEETRKLEMERENLLRDISLVTDRLRKIVEFIGDGRATETLRQELMTPEDRKRSMTERVAETDAKLRESRCAQIDEAMFREGLALFESLWEEAEEDEKAELLKLQVKVVIYSPDRIKVAYYPFPVGKGSGKGDTATIHSFRRLKPASGDGCRKGPVQRNSTSGGRYRT